VAPLVDIRDLACARERLTCRQIDDHSFATMSHEALQDLNIAALLKAKCRKRDIQRAVE
jgi:hypothetical protein